MAGDWESGGDLTEAFNNQKEQRVSWTAGWGQMILADWAHRYTKRYCLIYSQDKAKCEWASTADQRGQTDVILSDFSQIILKELTVVDCLDG